MQKKDPGADSGITESGQVIWRIVEMIALQLFCMLNFLLVELGSGGSILACLSVTKSFLAICFPHYCYI